MIRSVVFLLLVFVLTLPGTGNAQWIQFNTFESNFNLDVDIDSVFVNNLWQIGTPQKTLFNSSYSIPNALITDTVNSYPINNYSVCSFRADMSTLFAYPFFVIYWNHKFDSEFKVDGGWMEVSYDTGATWVNVFMDTTYTPLVAGGASIDTLANGQIGFTGTDTTWKEVMICWSAGTGNPAFPLNNFMDVRFVFWSDSVDTGQEGWLIDDLTAESTIIDFINQDRDNASLNINIYPNPVSEFLRIDILLEKQSIVKVECFDLQGKLLGVPVDELKPTGSNKIEIDLIPLQLVSGLYFIKCTTDEQYSVSRVIYIE